MNIIEEDIQFDEIMQRKQYQLICILLDKDISYYNQFVSKNGQPLLHTLIIDKQIEITHYILHIVERQCKRPKEIIDQVNESHQTPLMFACYYGLISLIRHLLKLEADINAADRNLFTPILFSMKSNQTFIVIYLIFKGADIFSKDQNGCGLAHFAAFNDNVFILKLVKNLFKFNIFEQDKLNKSPLKRAEDQCAYNSAHYIISQLKNKIDYRSTNKLINYFIQKQKINTTINTFTKLKCFIDQNLRNHISFLFIVIYHIYLMNIFVDGQDKLIKEISLFLQILIIFLNFIFFYIIESAPKTLDIQPEYSNTSLSFSQDQQRDCQGCLEIDQTGVPLIQEENNNNNSLSSICGNIIDVYKPFIRQIINQIDCGKQIDLELNQICLDCMMKKQPKTQHCEKCNCCHANYQLYSNFYMKCLIDDSIFKFYCLLISCQFLNSVIYLGNSNQLQQQQDYYYQLIVYQNIEFDFQLITTLFIAVLMVHQFIYMLLLFYSILSSNTLYIFCLYKSYEIMNKEKCWYRYKSVVQNGLWVRIIR